MEPLGTAVRIAVSPGQARPSGPKLSVLSQRSYYRGGQGVWPLQGAGVLSICPIGEVVLPTRPARRGAGGGGLRRRIPAMGVIDDYLEDLGDSQRAELERIRRIVLDRVPGR